MPFLSQNIELGPPLKLSPWRKIAIGTWSAPQEATVHGVLELNAEPMLKYLEHLNSVCGEKITVTHFVGKAVAVALKRHPELNCILRFGKLYPRKRVAVFFQVATDRTGEDLSGMTIYDTDMKSLVQIAGEMKTQVEKIRAKTDRTYTRMKSLIGFLPGSFSFLFLKLSSVFMFTLNLWSPLFGTPKDPFGSVMVTSIGSLGFEWGFAPLVPYSRVPFIIAVGRVTEKPVVEAGNFQIRNRIPLCATFDHRYIDGVHAHHLAKTLKAVFEDPEKELL